MEEVEQSEYVSRLRTEFDACDSTSSGFLDQGDLTKLCSRLHLDAHMRPLLDTLLPHTQVNFEEFKDCFVAVLSKTQDLSSSVVPEEMKPKFVKGWKHSGRRFCLDVPASEPDLNQDQEQNQSREGCCGARLQSTSLGCIKSLKCDDNNLLRDVQVEAVVPECDHGDTFHSQKLWFHLQNLEPDIQGKVKLTDVHSVLCSSLTSTPFLTSQIQSRVQPSSLLLPVPGGGGEVSFNLTHTSPSSSNLTVGQRLLSVLDDGDGTTRPENVLSLWKEEGLRDCERVLQVLDFSLDQRLSLSDLSVALENELLVSANCVHQAALICYRTELQHLQSVLEQTCRERDKAKLDLDQSDHRNLQLIRESEERQTSVENRADNRVRDMEVACRGSLAALRLQMEQEVELVLQQMEREKSTLHRQLGELTTRDSFHQGELQALRQENVSLEQELSSVRFSLTEAQSSVNKLQQDLDRLLLDGFSLDPSDVTSHEERFSEIIREYEHQYRELRDRNDELNSELELIKSQRLEQRPNRELNQEQNLNPKVQIKSQDQDKDQEQTSDYYHSEVKSSSELRRKLVPLNQTALVSLDSGVDSVSIQTELALEELREKHQEEIHQLTVKLETQMNYYERHLEQIRSSVELERKDISQAFKMEICELEEQKSDLETQLKQLKENMEKNLHRQSEQWSREQEKRQQRERAEMEQNFAREISNLVQRLSAEKDHLEAELRLKMDQELLLVRTQMEEVRSENCALQERLTLLQQEVAMLEEDITVKR